MAFHGVPQVALYTLMLKQVLQSEKLAPARTSSRLGGV